MAGVAAGEAEGDFQAPLYGGAVYEGDQRAAGHFAEDGAKPVDHGDGTA